MRYLRNTLFFLVLAFVLNSCQAPEAYKKALAYFNQGATLETKQSMGEESDQLPDELVRLNQLYPDSKIPDELGQEPSAYYQQSLTLLDKALAGESQLAKGNMLDNTLALQAITKWRTGDLDGARAAAEKALPLLNQDEDEQDIRDRALMQALPGLINLDQAFNALGESNDLIAAIGDLDEMTLTEKRNSYDAIKALYTKYVSDDSDGAPSVKRGLSLIDRALGGVEGGEDIQLYLTNARLAGLDTWGDMFLNVFKASRRLSIRSSSPEESSWIHEEQGKFEQARINGLEELAKLLDGGEDHALYKYWKKLL